MEISLDAPKLIASAIPVGLLIIAMHARGLKRRIRVVPKGFAKWIALLVVLASLASVALCFAVVNVGGSLTGLPAWFVAIASAALLVLTADTFVEFVVISMDEENETL